MFNRIEIIRDPETRSIGRYPWDRLSEPGDELVLFGRQMNSEGAVQSLKQYARRRGWRIRARRLGFGKDGWTVHFLRLGAQDQPTDLKEGGGPA